MPTKVFRSIAESLPHRRTRYPKENRFSVSHYVSYMRSVARFGAQSAIMRPGHALTVLRCSRHAACPSSPRRVSPRVGGAADMVVDKSEARTLGLNTISCLSLCGAPRWLLTVAQEHPTSSSLAYRSPPAGPGLVVLEYQRLAPQRSPQGMLGQRMLYWRPVRYCRPSVLTSSRL